MDKVVARIARVKILPDHLINQIAAGEVIERPASVVKELLDNSIDAGASRIIIDIDQGGVALIRVKDNGIGIHHDDLPLALTRHATSKIRSLDDLRKLVSLGFRGEALPSIASISRTTIMSRLKDEDHAWMIKSEGRSDHSQIEPVSHPQGTTVEVRDLFFNVPARRKYLRTERTEFYQIQQLVRHFAIAHPEIAVRLTHNGRQVLDVKLVSDRESPTRVTDIYGKKFMQNSIRLDSQTRDYCLSGWIGKPEIARTMNDSQFFCLNGRCIRDKRINHAIQQAFQDRLPVGRYAVYALNLSIDPAMVDVNVHPAKTEVRFREGRSVHDFIYSALHQALSDPQLPTIEKSMPGNSSTPSTRLSQTTHISDARGRSNQVVKETANRYRSNPVLMKKWQEQPLKMADKSSQGDRIGNVIWFKKGDHLLLVDIKKATTFLCEKKLLEQSVLSRPLLFPYRFTVDKTSADRMKKNTEILEQLGIRIFNDNHQWQLRQLPAVISIDDPDEFIESLIATIQDTQQDLKKSLITLLTKYAVDQQDEKRLLEQIGCLKESDQKIFIRKLSEKDLQKLIDISDNE